MTEDLATTDHHRVRRARPEDRGALLGLQSELPRPNPDLLRGALDADLGRVFVTTVDGCENGGIPVGYLLALDRTAGPPAGVEADADTLQTRSGAYVAELVVAPGHRREGRATGLLATLSTAVDGWVTLTVAPENDRARECYRSLEFEVLRRDPEFFDGDPALVMGRPPSGQ